MRRGAAILIALLCLTLARPALSVDTLGVTSERSGDVAVCVSTRRIAGFRLDAEAREDKALSEGRTRAGAQRLGRPFQ